MSADRRVEVPALRLAALIEAGADQERSIEILKLGDDLAALILEIEGVDHLLALTRARTEAAPPASLRRP